jgi:hypothetical protein
MSTPAEIAGIRSRGGRGYQEAVVISPVSGSAAAVALVGRARVTPPCLRLLEPVALAVQLQNMDMMRQAIEQRAGQTLAAEDAAPFLERQVRVTMVEPRS